MQEGLQGNLGEIIRVYTVWEATGEDTDWSCVLLSDNIYVALEEMVMLLVGAKPGTQVSVSVEEMSVGQFNAIEDEEERTIN